MIEQLPSLTFKKWTTGICPPRYPSHEETSTQLVENERGTAFAGPLLSTTVELPTTTNCPYLPSYTRSYSRNSRTDSNSRSAS